MPFLPPSTPAARPLPSRASALAVALVALVLSGVVPALAADAEADDGFRPLFDGRTLDGWVNVNCAPDTWSVKDGMIHCTGVPTGALRTDRQFENFILELEWRHLKPGGNAGVFIWSEAISAPGQPFLRAIEVQVLDNAYGKSDWFTTHGDIFPIHGSSMVPDAPSRGSRSFPSEFRSKGSPDWNHYRIECNDGVITLAVNGKQVSGGRDCVYRKGYIALESEGGIVDYRNLRIRELPSTGAGAEVTAPEARGHESLYTGTNLDGWTAAGGSRDGWKPADWTLTFSPSATVEDTASATLATTRTFENCEIICDWRWPETVPSSEALAPADGALVTLPPAGVAGGSNAKPDAWHRAIVRTRDGQTTISVDGKAIQIPNVSTAPKIGPIVLRPGGVKTEFASIYVRSLDESERP